MVRVVDLVHLDFQAKQDNIRNTIQILNIEIGYIVDRVMMDLILVLKMILLRVIKL